MMNDHDFWVKVANIGCSSVMECNRKKEEFIKKLPNDFGNVPYELSSDDIPDEDIDF